MADSDAIKLFVTDGHGDKYMNLLYISLGYLGLWIIGGISTAFYVRGKYLPADRDRDYYCGLTFWLFGLAIFLMWLLWFVMYAAQINPQIHPQLAPEVPEK